MSQTHVLEAVIVAAIMVSSVAYVVTLDGPAPADRTGRDIEQKMADLLAILDETPSQLGRCGANTGIDGLVLEAVTGGDAYWNARTDRWFPPGYRTNLWLDNYNDYLPLQVSYDFQGHARAKNWWPEIRSIENVTSLDRIDAGTTLNLETLGIYESSVVRTRGEAVRLAVSAGDDATKRLLSRAWAPTALLDDTSQSHARQAVGVATWRDGDGAVAQFINVNGVPQKIDLTIGAAPPRPGFAQGIPEGQPLEVSLPSSWEVSILPGGADDWQVEVIDSGGTSPRVVAFHAGGSPMSSKIAMTLTPPASLPARPFDVITASFGNGSLVEAPLVVKYPVALEGNLPQVVFPTVPYPMRPETVAFFGVTFANGGAAEVVTRVDVEIPGGYDLLRHDGRGAPLFRDDAFDLSLDESTDGEWVWLDARHVQWRGSRSVASGEVTGWMVGIPIAGVEAATSVEPPTSNGVVSTVSFENGFVSESRSWGNAPGVIRHRAPPAENATGATPATPGYPWVPFGSQSFDVTLDGEFVRLESTGSLVTSSAGGLLFDVDSATDGARFEVMTRLAPLNSTVHVAADVESLVSALAEAGVRDVDVVVDLYAPLTSGCAPVQSWRGSTGSMPLGRVNAVDVWNADGLDAIFVTGEDRKLHRVDALGEPRWSASLDAPGTHLARATAAGVGAVVLVGTQHGSVSAVLPTGVPLWNASLAAAPGPAAAIVGLASSGGEVWAASATGRVVALDAATGAILRDAMASSRAMSAAWLADGTAFLLHDGSVSRVSSEGDVTSRAGVPGTWMTAAPAGVFVSGDVTTMTLDPADLDHWGTATYGTTVRLGASADANLDGVMDHVLALGDGSLVVVDGADGSEHHVDAPEVEFQTEQRLPSGGIFSPSDLVGFDCIDTGGSDYGGCDDIVVPDLGTLDATARAFTPTLLAGTSAGLVYGWSIEGAPFLELYDASFAVVWQKHLSMRKQVTAAAAGAYGATADALATGGSDGIVTLWSAPTGKREDDVSVTSFTGRFGLDFRVPAGGFYGTHVVVARIGWQDAGLAREARLTDWFEVVEENGTVNPLPAYRVVLVVTAPDS